MSDEEKQHALFSPSGSHKWMKCPGSLAMESTCPNETTAYAAEGTAAHKLAEWTFKDKARNARAYLGRIISISENGKTHDIEVTEDMCEHVQKFVDDVMEQIDIYGLSKKVVSVELEIEVQVDFSHIVGEPNQFGTVDVLILVEYEDGSALLSVEDLKYGQGVEVYAEDNPQLKIYALAALHEYSLLYNITQVHTAIHMIRKGYISTFMYEAEELESFAPQLKHLASNARSAISKFEIEACSDSFQKMFLNPGEHCKKGFCKARGKCPALASFSMSRIVDDFVDLDDIEGEVKPAVERSIKKIDQGMIPVEKLAEFMKAADVIDDWLRAVRGRIEAELLNGHTVPGYKLVEGKKGNRYWTNSSTVETRLKKMRVKQDDIYTKKLITVAQAEKLFKSSKRKWNTLKKFIGQDDGKPSVAPESDKRKALEIRPVVDDFEVLDDNDDFDDLA